MKMTATGSRLILVRHGESTWNKENKFTGWFDSPLSEKGHKEAKAAGVLLKAEGIHFDIAFTSFLSRAVRTCWYALEETNQMHVPVHTSWRLNERHYGALQGLDKQQTVDAYGLEQVSVWRRSYDVPPPECALDSPHYPGNDRKYASVPEAAGIRTESLKITLDRVLPFWESDIAPQLREGHTVLVAAHGNSLRALVKHLDAISEKDIAELNIPTAVPLVYELDADLKPVLQPDAIAPLQGRYLGNQEDIRARILGVKNQTK